MKLKRTITIFICTLFYTLLTTAQTDATFLIFNPGFDLQYSGWAIKNVGNTAAVRVNIYPRFTYSACEFWSSTSDVYQMINDAPDGIYTITCNGFFRDGSIENAYDKDKSGKTEITAMLYANNDKVPLANIIGSAQKVRPESNGDNQRILPNGKYVPNEMESAQAYFQKGLYNNRVTTKVTDGKLKIGISAESCPVNGWYIYDNFKVSYKGDINQLVWIAKRKKPLYYYYLNSLGKYMDKLDSARNDIYKNNISYIDSMRTTYTNDVLNTDYTSIKEKGESLKKLISSIKSDKDHYSSLADKMDNMTSAAEIVKTANDINYFIGDIVVKIGDISKMQDDLKAMIENYISSNAKARIKTDNASPDNPIDVTDLYVKNPHFNSTKFWEFKDVTNPAYPRIAFSACELWSSKGDVFQMIYDVPNGVYSLSCQGFFRNGTVSNAYYQYKTSKNNITAMLYANEDKTPLCDIMSAAQYAPLCKKEEVTVENVYIPNGMESSQAYFKLGLYPNNVTTTVTDGKLRIGVRSDSWVPENWYIFTNFKLLYKGKKL